MNSPDPESASPEGQKSNPHDPIDQQEQGYVPPNEYGITSSQVSSTSSRRKSAAAEEEVLRIDRHLSSGCYFIYHLWLGVIAVSSVFTFGYSLEYFFAQKKRPTYLCIMGASVFSMAYAFVMTIVLRNKDLKTAKLGLNLAIFCVACIGIFIAGEAYILLERFDAAEPRNFMYGIPGVIYSLLVILDPAVKIFKHIERRQDILENGLRRSKMRKSEKGRRKKKDVVYASDPENNL